MLTMPYAFICGVARGSGAGLLRSIPGCIGEDIPTSQREQTVTKYSFHQTCWLPTVKKTNKTWLNDLPITSNLVLYLLLHHSFTYLLNHAYNLRSTKLPVDCNLWWLFKHFFSISYTDFGQTAQVLLCHVSNFIEVNHDIFTACKCTTADNIYWIQRWRWHTNFYQTINEYSL